MTMMISICLINMHKRKKESTIKNREFKAPVLYCTGAIDDTSVVVIRCNRDYL